MLSVDHIRARRRGSELEVTALKPLDRGLMLSYISEVSALLTQSARERREELEALVADIVVPSHLVRVAEGLKKMLFDRCEFTSPQAVDVVALRAQVFQVASRMRAALPDGVVLKREAVLIEVASALELDIYRIDDDLFGDLRGGQRLVRFTPAPPQILLSEYELAQEQAVLLRATELTVQIYCSSATTYRYFFRQLKFRRLLCSVTPREREEEGYEVKISGPHSLFQAVTKYGLQLAMLLPALRRCDRWSLSAQVAWGKEKDLLSFSASGVREVSAEGDEVDLPEELVTLLTQLKKHKTPWRARRSIKIIHLPGEGGVCVPDLVFSHPDHHRRVYLEVMGYWNREAVWRRVEWVRAGMREPVIFAVSSRLRVSERALEGDLPSALLVYKGAIVVSALARLLDDLAARAEGAEALDGSAEESAEEQGEDLDHLVAAALAAGGGAEPAEEQEGGELSAQEGGELSAQEGVADHLVAAALAEPTRIDAARLSATLLGVGLAEVDAPALSEQPPEDTDQMSLFDDDEG
jgi:predicted nuclease of restriction endonuclease-like RecB superfamily